MYVHEFYVHVDAREVEFTSEIWSRLRTTDAELSIHL